MRVIVADTSPIRYLVLIGEASVLQQLYGRILVPQPVLDELRRDRTPRPVRDWVESAPAWIHVVPGHTDAVEQLVLATLGSGEKAAIGLALSEKADLLLMDERIGTAEARRLGLTVTGTLGVLARASERGFVSLAPAMEKLLATNFRVSPTIIHQLLRELGSDP